MNDKPRTIEELERLAKDIIALNTPDSETPANTFSSEPIHPIYLSGNMNEDPPAVKSIQKDLT